LLQKQVSKNLCVIIKHENEHMLSSRYFAADRFPNLNNLQCLISQFARLGTFYYQTLSFYADYFTEIESEECLLNNYQFSHICTRSIFSVAELVYTFGI